MEERNTLRYPVPLTKNSGEQKPRTGTHSQSDIDRARSIAESFVRTVYTVEETLQVADQMYATGLQSCARGETSHGGIQLTRSLVGTALGVWQYDRLATTALAERTFNLARTHSARAVRHFNHLPARIQIAAVTLRTSESGSAVFDELRVTVLAFVSGSELAERVLEESDVNRWQREFQIACDPVGLTQGNRITEFGAPDLSLNPRPAELNRQHPRNGSPGLSAREREVLTQIVSGLTTAEIAYRLGVKTTTVATLVGRIFNKLGVNNRPSAVAAALRYGMCTQDE